MSPSNNAEPQAESSRQQNAEPYTIFSNHIRYITIGLLGAAMLASPLSATMYLPLLPVLSTHYGVGLQEINLTITVYVIFQAIAPLLLASPSDHLGRRPVYLTTFTIYALASLGLALNKSSFAALLVLRAFQSLGASAVLSVSYGTVADISTPAERGKLLGPLMTAGNLGTCVGPIIGGWIAFKSGGFRSAFWALFIFSVTMLALLALFLPETARKVVGNGSIPEHWWNQPFWDLLKQQSTYFTLKANLKKESPLPQRRIPSPIAETDCVRTIANHSLVLTSPLASFRVLFYADTALIIFIGSTFYGLWYTVQASLPHIYGVVYHFNELQIGLAYLPGSVGVILSMFVSGRIIDRNYRITAQKLGLSTDKKRVDDLARFPIEEARSKYCAHALLLSVCFMTVFGWTIQKRVHVSVPLICQFFQGFLVTFITQAYSALLVDGFPETPSTAATAGNMTRCVVSAVLVAILNPLITAMGYGWFYWSLGMFTGLGGFLAQYLLRTRGMSWRNRRLKKVQVPTTNIDLDDCHRDNIPNAEEHEMSAGSTNKA